MSMRVLQRATGLPFDNVLSLKAVAAYRNVILKPSLLRMADFLRDAFTGPCYYLVGKFPQRISVFCIGLEAVR